MRASTRKRGGAGAAQPLDFLLSPQAHPQPSPNKFRAPSAPARQSPQRCDTHRECVVGVVRTGRPRPSRELQPRPQGLVVVHQHLDRQDVVSQLLQLGARLGQLGVRLRAVMVMGRQGCGGWVGGVAVGAVQESAAAHAGRRAACRPRARSGGAWSAPPPREAASPHLRQLRAHRRPVTHRLAQLRVRRLRSQGDRRAAFGCARVGGGSRAGQRRAARRQCTGPCTPPQQCNDTRCPPKQDLSFQLRKNNQAPP